MESKLERVFTNHCQLHSKPLSNTTVPVSLQVTNSPTGEADRIQIRPGDVNTSDGQSTHSSVRLTSRVLQSNSSDPNFSRSSDLGDTLPGTPTAVATAVVEVPAVCESCVERISTHIKDLCRRALHKAQFVPYKPPNTAVTTIAASTPPS